jgi:hypothetical protein
MQASQIGQAQCGGHLLHKGRLLAHRVHAGHVQFGTTDRNHHTGEPRSRSHVKHARGRIGRSIRTQGSELLAQRRDDGEAVQQVVRQHVGRLTHGSEVVDLVPFVDQVQIGDQQIDLAWRQRQADHLGRANQRFAEFRGGFGHDRARQVTSRIVACRAGCST